MITNYEGYWETKSGEKLIFCSKKSVYVLNCETERCTTNCLAAYDIKNVELISQHDSNNIGHYDRYNGIRWSNNDTWTKKGQFDESTL